MCSNPGSDSVTLQREHQMYVDLAVQVTSLAKEEALVEIEVVAEQ